MMDLTPLEVRQKKGDFRRTLRGYDPELVNDFLDIVADRLEALVRENMQFAERLGLIEEQVGEYRERERAMTEALVTAQEMREELRRQAARDAELARREAELDASRIRSAAAQETERERDTLLRLRARRAQMVQTYRSFLERELTELGIMEQALASEPEPDLAERPARRAGAQSSGPQPSPELELTPPEPAPTAGESSGWTPDAIEEPQLEESRPARARGRDRTEDKAEKATRSQKAEKGGPAAEDMAREAGGQRDWLSSILEDRS